MSGPGAASPRLAALGRALANRRWTALLIFLAAVPFLPYLFQFLRDGVPDVLFDGDGAVLELRTLYAARGAQLVGPYSRFLWSHPGPAYFYLALPFYALFHLRGPALNLAVLFMNGAAAVALVLTARRLRGELFALMVACTLGLYEMTAPFPLSGEWNPIVPILPLALLVFLALRLGSGAVTAAPAVAFVASAIVQTHLGFSPTVLYLAATGGLFWVRERCFSGAVPDTERRRLAGWAAATAGVLLIMWALPLYENATQTPGNLRTLRRFFASPHPIEHGWRTALDVVAGQLAALPVAVARLVARVPAPSTAARVLVAGVEVAGVAIALAVNLRRRDAGGALLAAVTLGSIAVAVVSVRQIRGEILDYLVCWVSVLGFVAMVALISPWLAPRARRGRAVVLAVGLPLLALALHAQGIRPASRGPEPQLDRLVADVERYLRENPTDGPVLVEINAHDEWPHAAGLILALVKHRIPVTVTDDWLFMFGPQLRSGGREPQGLVVADAPLAAKLSSYATRHLIAQAGGTWIFIRDRSAP